MTYQRIATQRLDKHPAIHARNYRTNVYSSLLCNSQRVNGLGFFFLFVLPLLAIRITYLSQWSGLCTILIEHYLDFVGITSIEVSLVS
jgi:hypothetical protein